MNCFKKKCSHTSWKTENMINYRTKVNMVVWSFDYVYCDTADLDLVGLGNTQI